MNQLSHLGGGQAVQVQVLVAALAWKGADPGTYQCHYDIQGLEVDVPDAPWELHDDPRCES